MNPKSPSYKFKKIWDDVEMAWTLDGRERMSLCPLCNSRLWETVDEKENKFYCEKDRRFFTASNIQAYERGIQSSRGKIEQ